MKTIDEMGAHLMQAFQLVEAAAAEAPEVIVTGDSSAPLRCPVCRVDSAEWVEIDWAEYRQIGGEASQNAKEVVVTFYDGDRDFYTVTHGCSNCGAAVRMPTNTVTVMYT